MTSKFWVCSGPLVGLWISGCIGQPLSSPWPDARPLGSGIPTYRPGEESYSGASEARPAQEPTGVVTLREVCALALMHNPRLAAFSWDVRAAEARRLQASLLPNPEAELELEEFGGNRDGLSDMETTVSLRQLLLVGGKRAKRTRLAELRGQRAGWQYESKRLDVLTDAARSFAAVLGAEREMEQSAEAVRLAGEVAGTVRERMEAGAASPVEQTRAEVARAAAENELRRAKQTLAAARIRLAATWGSSEPRFSGVRGDLEIEVAVPPVAALRDHLSQNPELMGAAADVVAEEAAIELEKSKALPDVTVYAGYRRLESERGNTMVAGISVPLPIFNRNQGTIREAEANLARAEWRKRAVETEVHAALAEAHSALAGAVEEQSAFKSAILPGALSAFEATRVGYEQGKFDYVNVLTAQQTLAQTRVDYVRVLVRVHHALARVERLLGEPLVAHGTGTKP